MGNPFGGTGARVVVGKIGLRRYRIFATWALDRPPSAGPRGSGSQETDNDGKIECSVQTGPEGGGDQAREEAPTRQFHPLCRTQVGQRRRTYQVLHGVVTQEGGEEGGDGGQVR